MNPCLLESKNHIFQDLRGTSTCRLTISTVNAIMPKAIWSNHPVKPVNEHDAELVILEGVDSSEIRFCSVPAMMTQNATENFARKKERSRKGNQ